MKGLTEVDFDFQKSIKHSTNFRKYPVSPSGESAIDNLVSMSVVTFCKSGFVKFLIIDSLILKLPIEKGQYIGHFLFSVA